MVPQHHRRGHQGRIGNQLPLPVADVALRCPICDGPWLSCGQPLVVLSDSPCLARRRCRGQMDSMAASLAMKPIVLRPLRVLSGARRMTRITCPGPPCRGAPGGSRTGLRVMGSGRSSPTPLSMTLILGPAKPPKSGPGKGRISPVFWALRCKVMGGWGGSAHYPDPTAQSAPRAAREPSPPAGRSRGPDLPEICQKCQIFFFSSC